MKDVPLVYRCLIERLREYGIGVPEKDVYPEYLAWLEKYGIEPRASIKDRTGRLTEKEIEEETSLRKAWDKSEEKRIYMECRNKKLSSIPPEHREMVIKLKEFNVGKVQKDVFEEIVAWLEKHGTLPRGEIRAVAGDGSKKTKSRYEYTKSERIEFIGGIRGLKELEKRANNDMKVSFAMFATTIDDIMSIADGGMIMPPKSTWFEPKPRSGLFIHKLI